nr:hypothetical protein [uncultured Desulfuromonas sp.]
MYLMIGIEDILDLSKLNYKQMMHKELASVAGKDPRSIRRYLTNQQFPENLVLKFSKTFERYYKPYKISNPQPREVIPLSWIILFGRAKEVGFEMVPQSVKLIESLAKNDIVFLHKIDNAKSAKERFKSYQDYLTRKVIPFYFQDGSLCDGGDRIKSSKSVEELKKHLPVTLLQSILFLLSHFEAEYLSSNENYQKSVLGQCITQEPTCLTSHKLLKLWLDGLEVDKPKFVEIMLKSYGDPDDAEISPDSQSLEKESWEMHYYLHFEKGQAATFGKVERWAKGLHSVVIQQQKDYQGSPDEYAQFAADLFFGGRLLDRIIKGFSTHTLTDTTTFNISDTYNSLFDYNMKRIRTKKA